MYLVTDENMGLCLYIIVQPNESTYTAQNRGTKKIVKFEIQNIIFFQVPDVDAS